MEDDRYPKQLLNCRHIGRRTPERPLKELTRRIQSWGRNRSFIGV